ncbi:hypothetical protein XAC1491 [Xanthomonas citri pv. citri str. 306]|uniref:Uncharacterized protein n=1 Tax=Xanthomonas axonopodis pv. citri (strain 306) TaxID=190486 RepID=A0AAI7ZEJ9_XANAC|nr:hypothetical protein XAC1491 [Xanthomonas citri pv. citri str. 306]
MRQRCRFTSISCPVKRREAIGASSEGNKIGIIGRKAHARPRGARAPACGKYQGCVNNGCHTRFISPVLHHSNHRTPKPSSLAAVFVRTWFQSQSTDVRHLTRPPLTIERCTGPGNATCWRRRSRSGAARMVGWPYLNSAWKSIKERLRGLCFFERFASMSLRCAASCRARGWPRATRRRDDSNRWQMALARSIFRPPRRRQPISAPMRRSWRTRRAGIR